MTHRLDNDLDRQLSQVALEENVDPNLLRAFTIVETNANRWAARYEPGFTYFCSPPTFAGPLGISLDTEIALQRISWGPMQIMGAVAREVGFADHLTKLTDGGLAYLWSVAHLKRLMKKYAIESDVISAWNQGSARKGNDGKYINQVYVDRVMAAAADFRKA